MPIFIKSAIPGLTNRTAAVLQVGLLVVVGVLAALPREDTTVAVARSRTATLAPIAAPPVPQEANLAFSTIEVVVSRNDTMDRLFRRFELNLADLATLRNLPELRSQVDKLRPGESLRFMPVSYTHLTLPTKRIV